MDENQAMREAVANEVFGNDAGAQTTEAAPIEQKTEVVEGKPIEAKPAEPADPWEGVPPAIRAEVEALRDKVSNIGQMEGRLKQAESRLGGVLNELHAAKEAAKSAKSAPSSEQMAQASASPDDWETLKTEWPEWAKATDSRLAAERAEILKQMPDMKSFEERLDARLARIDQARINDLIEAKHRGWEAKVNTPEFIQWQSEQGNPDSDSPHEVIALLDKFDAYQSTKKTAKEINAERAERLKKAETTVGRKLPPIKSEADMSMAEIRAAEARKIWGS